ncbi:MAG: prolyl oligopeptidase family serine peptidase [Candidatus Dormiibacterota bacterium]
MTPIRSGGPAPPAIWPSPITAQQAAAGGMRLSDIQLDGDDAYWIEGRPTEGGRCVIVRERDGAMSDMIAAPWSARTWVHEYGGAAMRAHRGTVYFSNAADQRVYRVDTSDPEPVTPGIGDVRYADFEVDAPRDRMVCVVEDHRGQSVVNDIRTFPISGGEPVTIVAGNDFYSTPRISPDGRKLAWLTWNFPNMPWDGCELWVAELDEAGLPRGADLVAGGARESITQPAWSPESVLHFSTDRTGWWNLCRFDGGTVTPIAPMEAECGAPQWTFGLETYAFCDGGRILLWACRDGAWEFHRLEPSGAITRLETPYTQFGYHVNVHGDDVLFLAGGTDDPMSVVRYDLATGACRVLGNGGGGVTIDESMLSRPVPVTYTGHGGDMAHAWYYQPRNDAVDPGSDYKPPLLVRAHGGPTSNTNIALSPAVQYWTSRGFAYLDVDYGGSTGYGRAYRERLNGQSGVVDVGDCVAGARYLVERGDVDPDRLFIHGGSAGGYIVLCAMVFHDTFSAGMSLFGIADLEVLFDQDPHKFESHYTAPYDMSLLRERSPVHFIDRVRGAVLLLQGLDDPVVPARQAELMFDALQSGGVPCAYIGFPGEQHGFRQAQNIARSAEAELYFASTVTGTPLDETIEPVEILNFPAR